MQSVPKMRITLFRTVVYTLLFALCSFCLLNCNPPKRAGAGVPQPRPGTSRPTAPNNGSSPVDTIRWKPAPNTAPPIGNAPNAPRPTEPYLGQNYRLALLLPFLTDQAGGQAVPDKSSLALQFYAGASLALQKLSTEENMNLTVDVLDTRIDDTDFQRLFTNPRLNKAQVIIGPIRSSHVSLMAERIKQTRQILISPESPNMDLTANNPDFIQTNPSLRAHCAAIARYILERHRPDAVVLVSKQKEADRLPYFQQALPAGSAPFAQLLVPDETTSFDRIDLRPYLRPGRTAVFVLPSWASQNYVMAFLQKLRASKGSARVEVYGMPQWKGFTSIEPEYFSDLNVHISSAYFVDRNAETARRFRQAFYEAYGTVPNDDAYKGFDVTWFAGLMLKKYGLSFPQRLAGAEPFVGMHNQFRFAKVFSAPPVVRNGANDALDRYDYLENFNVQILKYQNYQFLPKVD